MALTSKVGCERRRRDSPPCCEPDGLNANIPAPRAASIFDKLDGKLHFSKIDFQVVYLQFPVEEKSRRLTAFVTPYGQYEFNRVPFGLPASGASIILFSLRAIVQLPTSINEHDLLVSTHAGGARYACVDIETDGSS